MKREDVNRALNKAESFTDYILISIAGFPKPFTSLVVWGGLLAVFIAGLLL